MAGNRLRLVAAACALAASSTVACTQAGSTPAPTPAPITVLVGGAIRHVTPGTTFGQLTTDLELHAAPGRLLSITGQVLEPRHDPGEVLLNGATTVRRIVLIAGDRVTIVDGQDAIEGTRRVVTELPGLHPAVPQRTLATYPMEQIDTVGRISGDIQRTEFRPVGKATLRGEVALTFDDGPWPQQTRRVLKVLHRFHARATFFMVGDLVDRYPGIVRDVMGAGMPIGNHSWSHPIDPPFADLLPHRLQTELARTDDALRAAGARPYMFRPPGGSYDADVLREVRAEDLRTVTWSVDPQDYVGSKTRKQIATSVLRRVHPGSIVLLHDGGGDQRATIAALPEIIRGIRKMGLKLVAIPRDRRGP